MAVPCSQPHAVVVLSLSGFGLAGSLPADVARLSELTVLGLASNPRLAGALPEGLLGLQHLLWVSVEVSGWATWGVR